MFFLIGEDTTSNADTPSTSSQLYSKGAWKQESRDMGTKRGVCVCACVHVCVFKSHVLFQGTHGTNILPFVHAWCFQQDCALVLSMS